MMSVRWLAIVGIIALLTGCANLWKPINPYAEKPDCGPAGSWQTKECFYEFEMTQTAPATVPDPDEKKKTQTIQVKMNLPPGWASGRIPRQVITRNKEDNDGWDLAHFSNRRLEPEKYPEYIYVFQVEGHSGDFAEKDLARFVSKPFSTTLIYLGSTTAKEDSEPIGFCAKVEEWMKNEMVVRNYDQDYYKKGYEPSRDDQYISKCSDKIGHFFR